MRHIAQIVTFLAAFAVHAHEDQFEADNLDISEALGRLGIDVSALPGFEEPPDQCSLSACSIVVCITV